MRKILIAACASLAMALSAHAQVASPALEKPAAVEPSPAKPTPKKPKATEADLLKSLRLARADLKQLASARSRLVDQIKAARAAKHKNSVVGLRSAHRAMGPQIIKARAEVNLYKQRLSAAKAANRKAS